MFFTTSQNDSANCCTGNRKEKSHSSVFKNVLPPPQKNVLPIVSIICYKEYLIIASGQAILTLRKWEMYLTLGVLLCETKDTVEDKTGYTAPH